jgi:GNAT superfamily N-acetyltransferase
MAQLQIAIGGRVACATKKRRCAVTARLSILTQHGMLSVRPETGGPSEEAFLYLLFASIKAPEMSLMPVDAQQKEFLLQMQYKSMNYTYRNRFPKARFEIVELDRWPIGRVVTDVQKTCVYYVDIALMPQAHGKGIGTALMSAMLAEPRRLGLPARAKVLSHNIPSLRMFERFGFTRVATKVPYVDLEWRSAA